jgi:hypothetical protein
VSLNNEKICCEISEDKIAFCEKTAGLQRGKFSDSNSACLKVLVPVKIFQFQDMLNESERYQDAANGLFTKDLKSIVEDFNNYFTSVGTENHRRYSLRSGKQKQHCTIGSYVEL